MRPTWLGWLLAMVGTSCAGPDSYLALWSRSGSAGPGARATWRKEDDTNLSAPMAGQLEHDSNEDAKLDGECSTQNGTAPICFYDFFQKNHARIHSPTSQCRQVHDLLISATSCQIVAPSIPVWKHMQELGLQPRSPLCLARQA